MLEKACRQATVVHTSCKVLPLLSGSIWKDSSWGSSNNSIETAK